MKSAETVTKKGIPYMHIINASYGFVIMSADSTYPPLLAYDSANNFDKNSLNAGLAIWFNKHGNQIDFVRNTKSVYADSIKAKNKVKWKWFSNQFDAEQLAKKNFPTLAHTNGVYTGPPTTNYRLEIIQGLGPSYLSFVGPLLHSHFTQGYPYNALCPSGHYGGSLNTPAGCVPVAIGQVMGYWQYGIHNGGSYNWSILSIHEPIGTNQAGLDEDGRFIHDIGTTIIPGTALSGAHQLTSYADQVNGTGGSGSDEAEIPVLFQQWGYSSAQNTESIGNQQMDGAKNGAVYAALLNSEVQSNRPCIIGAYPNQGTILGLIYWPKNDGHTWVCDGSYEYFTSDMFTYNYYDPSTNALIYSTVAYGETYPIAGLIHLNWGLSGAITNPGGVNNNGWYDSQTNYTSNPADGNNYWYFQIITYNIHP